MIKKVCRYSRDARTSFIECGVRDLLKQISEVVWTGYKNAEGYLCEQRMIKYCRKGKVVGKALMR